MKNKNWLKDNVTSILAIMWSASAIAMYFVILLKKTESDDKIVFMVAQAITGIAMFILGYYYSDSKSKHTADKETTVSVTETNTATEDKK